MSLLFSLLPLLRAEPPIDPAPPPEGAAPEAEAAPEGLLTVEALQAILEAQGVPTAEATQAASDFITQEEFEASLQYQHGDIQIAEGRATLHVPEGFGYLSPADSDRVLVAWGNPPGGGGQGMLVPEGAGLFGESGWAVIVDYEEDGYVSDEDAEEIDYDELLEGMKQLTEDSNATRVAAGYQAIHLDNWAEPPHYEGSSHKLYWAKVLSSDDGLSSLNYDIRVLGRQGVISMSAVAAITQLQQVKVEMEKVLTFAEFNEGHRYEDFNPDVDKVAAYGIGALVAGGIAAKSGLLKGLIAMLIAGKKVIFLAFAAGLAALKGLFGQKNKT